MADFLFEPLGQPFMQTALVEMIGLSVLVGVIGTFVVLRSLSYFTLALSHGVFPGVVLAYLLGWNYLALSLVAGLLISALVGLVRQNKRVNSDAAIASVYTGTFALGIVMVIAVKTFRGLSDIIFGRMFAISWGDILTTAIAGSLALALMFVFRRQFLLIAFDPISARAEGLPVTRLEIVFMAVVALTVIIALPAVGNIQLVALFVAAPASARLLTERLSVMLVLSGGYALVGSVVGLYLAYHFVLVPGATIILTLTFLFLLTFIFSPQNGLIARLKRSPEVSTPSVSR